MDEKVSKTSIRIVIPEVPNRKIRHRDYLIKGTSKRVHVNPNQKAEERFLGLAMSRKPDKPFSGALRVNVVAVYPYLKKHYKKDGSLKVEAPQYKTSTPDIDNVGKFVFDSLNKIYWKDDAIIADSRIVKVYGSPARTEITIQEL